MKTAILISAFIGIFYLSSCTSSGGDLEQLYFDKGEYAFTIFTNGGDSMASGTFDIKTITGKDITGTYVFDNEYIESQLITVKETKEMEGSLSEDRKQLFINANPRMSDANIFLRITAGLLSYSGEWSYNTYVGMIDNGKIKAFKRN
jgi:hypothetical protein